jgi:hypothetical protein
MKRTDWHCDREKCRARSGRGRYRQTMICIKVADFLDKIMGQNKESETMSDSLEEIMV